MEEVKNKKRREQSLSLENEEREAAEAAEAAKKKKVEEEARAAAAEAEAKRRAEEEAAAKRAKEEAEAKKEVKKMDQIFGPLRQAKADRVDPPPAESQPVTEPEPAFSSGKEVLL